MHPSGMGLQIIDGPILGEQMVRLSEITVPSGDTFAGLDVNHGSLDQKCLPCCPKNCNISLDL